MDILTTTDIFIRLLVAIGLGALLGLERTLAGKTAGMRTYAMVALGSSLFVIIAKTVLDTFYSSSGANPLYMTAQIIVGIGFIGAGLVIFQDHKITGLTTAAGLWVVAGVGISCGYGLYSIALSATILALIIFTILWFVEKKLKFLSYNGDKNDSITDESK